MMSAVEERRIRLNLPPPLKETRPGGRSYRKREGQEHVLPYGEGYAWFTLRCSRGTDRRGGITLNLQ